MPKHPTKWNLKREKCSVCFQTHSITKPYGGSVSTECIYSLLGTVAQLLHNSRQTFSGLFFCISITSGLHSNSHFNHVIFSLVFYHTDDTISLLLLFPICLILHQQSLNLIRLSLCFVPTCSEFLNWLVCRKSIEANAWQRWIEMHRSYYSRRVSEIHREGPCFGKKIPASLCRSAQCRGYDINSERLKRKAWPF